MKTSVERLFAVGLSSAALMAGCSPGQEKDTEAKPEYPPISFADQIMNGLRAVYDEDASTKFDTSDLKMKRLPKEVGSTALRLALTKSTNKFIATGGIIYNPLNRDRARATVTCAAVAINNPDRDVFRVQSSKKGFDSLNGGETTLLLVEKTEGDDTVELHIQAKDAFNHAEDSCLKVLRGSKDSLDIPVGTK